MKVKLKLDSQKLKQLALEHVEKGVFGLLLLIAVMMMLKSFGLPKFTRKPEDFKRATDNAQRTLQMPEGQAKELVHKELKPKQYLAIANKNTEKFMPDGFGWANVKPQVFPSGGLRKEPQYVLVEDLRAVASRSVFDARAALTASVADEIPVSDDDADAAPAGKANGFKATRPPAGTGRAGPPPPRPRTSMSAGGAPTLKNGSGLSYVVVTGRIPYAKQVKAYKEAFGSAEQRLITDNDPQYLLPTVERAEVNPGVADKDLKWVKVSGARADSTVTKQRLTTLPDPYLDARYENAVLTESLFKLTQGEWEPEIIVPEEFRAKDQAPDALAAEAAVPAAADPAAAGDDAIRPDEFAPANPGAVRGGPPRTGSMSAGSMSAGSRPAGSMSAGSMSAGSRPRVAPGIRPGGAGNMQAGTMVAIDKYLFRFFDFSAEPGKRYRYRVRLFFKNPNLGVDPRYLEDPKLAQQDYRYSAASDPTEPASVPNDGTLIAGTYKPAPPSGEAAANVVLTQFIERGGRTAIKEFNQLYRGQLANIDAKAAEAMILEDETGDLLPSDESIKFQNNLMLLDVSPADKNKPADVLIMNGEGKLVVLSGEAEKDRFADLSKKLAKAKLDALKASKEEKDNKRDKERAARRPPEDKDKKDKDKDTQDGNLLDPAAAFSN